MAKIVSNMKDMKLTPQEKIDYMSPSAPAYPYGLCLSLCQDELEKLGLLDEDIEVGDMLHLQCMTKVTSISENDNETTGPTCRIELQITHMGSVENEDTEFSPRRGPSKFYKA